MPQLTKGGKWIFGWCLVGPSREIRIPQQAYSEYGFQPGEAVILIQGSKRSGGFGVARQGRLAQAQVSFRSRFIGQARVGEDRYLALPAEVGVQPGERLLAVRGSGLALGFLLHGPVYEQAIKHPEVEVLGT